MAKPECSRKKRRRRRRSRPVEDRKAGFVTRWRPETTFGYRSFEPGEKGLQVDVVSLELEQQRRGESPKNPDERLKSSRYIPSGSYLKAEERALPAQQQPADSKSTKALDTSTRIRVLLTCGGRAAKAAGDNPGVKTDLRGGD